MKGRGVAHGRGEVAGRADRAGGDEVTGWDASERARSCGCERAGEERRVERDGRVAEA